MIKTLGLCGSLRADSYNLKLLRSFFSALSEKGGFEPAIYDSLDLPLVNQDLEKSPLDSKILRFQAAVSEAPVLVVASPEYNGSISGPLKNAIDWATRPSGTNLWAGKVIVLLAASPGALGGVRGLIHVRTIFAGLKAWVIPEQVQCGTAHQAFDEKGNLTADLVTKQIQGSIQSLEIFTKKMLP
jgi:NAD(P)H-dependent FMN reductase